ncbi:MAG: hypothetical protein JXB07_02555 [Anaerolineae bacterium]|nr:hypothetical protein [Anaerolineae bacterium]
MVQNALIWAKSQVLRLWRSRLLAIPVFLVSELLVLIYWIEFAFSCSGTFARIMLMFICNGGDPVFAIDFLIVAPGMLLVWWRGNNNHHANALKIGLLVYYLFLRFVRVWLMAHWQVLEHL